MVRRGSTVRVRQRASHDLQRLSLLDASPEAGSLEAVERQHIIQILKRVGGHRAKAATLLGIDPKTLYRKILSYGIDIDQLRS